MISNPIRKIFIVSLLCCIATGCTTQWAYNNLDWIVLRGVNKYVDLNEPQEQRLRDALDQQQDWLCSTQLPVYAEQLRMLQQELMQQSVTVAKLQRYGENISQHWHTLMQHILPDGSSIIRSLTDPQIAELLQNMDEAHQEQLDEFEAMDQQQRLDSRIDDMRERAERQLGDLTDQQNLLINQWSLNSLEVRHLQLEHRRQWRIRFAAALAVRNDATEFLPLLEDITLNNASNRDDTYRQHLHHNRRLTTQLIFDLLVSADAQQREHVSERLEELADDLQELSCS